VAEVLDGSFDGAGVSALGGPGFFSAAFLCRIKEKRQKKELIK